MAKTMTRKRRHWLRHPVIVVAVARSDVTVIIHVHTAHAPVLFAPILQDPSRGRGVSIERKIDFMAKKLEEVSRALGNIEDRPRSSAPSDLSPKPTPENQATSSPAGGGSNRILTPKSEHHGESSLSAHASHANKLLRDTVRTKPPLDVAGRMASVLDTLNRSVKHREAEDMYPHARTLESGCRLRDMPMPPVESALACLRMAQEHPRVKMFWLYELCSMPNFTEHFLKLYSPGDAIHADMIVVNAGLYWLFRECKNVTPDSTGKSNLESHARICRDNLETVLSNLPFHMPMTIVTVFALSLAALYCFELCKLSSAWSFMVAASQMSQTMGFHSAAAMSRDDSAMRKQKMNLFWTIYIYEKGLALRLGRPSTIRDSEITIPRMEMDRSDTVNWGWMPKWIELARLQGMTYDQIYSPSVWSQPQAIRASRARRLASDLEALTTRVTPEERRYMDMLRQSVGDELHEVLVRTDRVVQLSLLCLIYKGVPAETGDATASREEYISTAREALDEHQTCMSIIANMEDDFLETYINWALLQFPFVPFIILFCHIIETCNEDDLDRLRGLIENLESAAVEPFSTGVKKELRLFRVLYDVACSYVNLKIGTAEMEQTADLETDDWGHVSALMPSPSCIWTLAPAPEADLATDAQRGTFSTELPQLGVSQDPSIDHHQVLSGGSPGGPFGELNLEVDQQGLQLGNWLYMNDQMMRVLEDTYF
ncbi:hypothetical protein BHE90_001940 [Fusarium euwallaceae]|uniref:Xylanolytic transcriptional activator regulatory domain-containing protein n=1 Tax=Fusarium euwallaceae TaxID=1147111 RepID=A0A430M6H9_9HYPO|nr:hypothetical protein BHE90_001940 [Fusarium euwallaceae]